MSQDQITSSELPSTTSLEEHPLHVDQYTQWVRLEDDEEEVVAILAGLPNMSDTESERLIAYFSQQYKHPRDRVVAMADYCRRVMTLPNGPHFAFKMRDAISQLGQKIKLMKLDKASIMVALHDLQDRFEGEMESRPALREVFEELVEGITGPKSPREVIHNVLRSERLLRDERAITLIEIHQRHRFTDSGVITS